MRVRVQRRGLVPAVLITILGVLGLYLASTWGWAALRGTASGESTGVGTLPAAVERPPSSVGTTEEYGPLGAVSLAFAGTDVRDGLLGELDPVWLAVSSRTGEYRALSVPDLPDPAPGAVAVSPAGDRLAWVGEEGLEVYDPLTDELDTLDVPGVSAVGSFSPDGSLLLVATDQLAAVDVGSGDVVTEVAADPAAVRRAAWRPDGSAVDVVVGDDLVTTAVPGAEATRSPTDLPERAQLAWSPSGEQLVSLQPTSQANRLHVASVGPDGNPRGSVPVPTPGIALQRLVGFSGDDSVAVVALALESGAIERVLDVPLRGGSADDLTVLPDPGTNWAGSGTLGVATDTLTFGSTDFDEHIWPWSYQSRLVACILVGVFFLGLFVTRRPR